MKVFKFKNIINIILCLLLSLPFFAIFGRVIYTINNKNAYESYYGETINEEIYHDISYNHLVPNETYYFSNELLLDVYTQTQQSAIYYTSINWVSPTISFNLNNANNFRFYVNSEGIPRMYFYNGNTSFGRPFDLNNESINFSFTYSSSSNLQYNELLLSNVTFQYKTFNKYSFLDNAFEYSLSTFTQENNFGNLDFFSWFSDIFLDTANNHNMLYINFVNWYLNYALYISISYILFMILMWIVKLLRSILDSFGGGKLYD